MPEDTIPTEKLPANAVIRVSRGNFDPSQFTKVDTLAQKQAEYLVPAIKQLPGLIHWYTGVSPEGSMTQVSVWDRTRQNASGQHTRASNNRPNRA
jgi:hypothetical protein